jgi:hypothetical protein
MQKHGDPEIRAVKVKLPNMRYFLNFFFSLKKVLSSELNTSSQSVLPIIHHVLERLQRDLVKTSLTAAITWSSLVKCFPSKWRFR